MLKDDCCEFPPFRPQDVDVNIDLCGHVLTLSSNFSAHPKSAGAHSRFALRNGTLRSTCVSGACLKLEDYASVELTNVQVEGRSECIVDLWGCKRSVLSNVCVIGTMTLETVAATLPERCVGVRCEIKPGRCRVAGLSMFGCQIRSLVAERTATGVYLKGLRCIRVCGLSVDTLSAEEDAAGLVCCACSNGAFDSYEARNMWSRGTTSAGQFLDGTNRCEIFGALVLSTTSPQGPSATTWRCSSDSQVKVWELEGGRLQQRDA